VSVCDSRSFGIERLLQFSNQTVPLLPAATYPADRSRSKKSENHRLTPFRLLPSISNNRFSDLRVRLDVQ
jgi:hypothetical protein